MTTCTLRLPLHIDAAINLYEYGFQFYLLFALADSRTIRPALGRITTVAWVVNASFIVRALNPSNPTTSLRFGWCTLALVVDGNPRRCRSTCIAVGLAVTTTDRLEFLGTNRRLGFAGTLRIRDLALAYTKITVLPCWASEPPDGPTNRVFGRWVGCRIGIWLVITSGKHKGEATTD
jgi:hypothetical protein